METPLGRAASRVFLRHRSIVAALIRPSSRNADPSQSASPPCARSVGIHRGKLRLEVPRARQIHHQPHLDQQLARLLRIPLRPLRRCRRFAASGLGEPRLAVLLPIVNTEHISSRMRSPILLRCPHVLVPEPQSDLLLRCHADSAFHKTSQTGPVPFALIPDEAPLRITRSKNVRHVASHGSRHTKSIITITRRGYIDGRNGDFVKIPVILNMST